MPRPRRLAICLGLALLAQLVPAEADACSGSFAFQLDQIWPADGATDVPLDGIILIVGTAYANPDLTVDVDVAGAVIPGAVAPWSDGTFVWTPDAPLEPSTDYHVKVSDAGILLSELSFVTGTELAAEPAAPTLTLQLEQYEHEIQECADDTIGGCFCEKWKTVDVEHRMSARVALSPASAPFGGFNLAEIELAPSPDAFPAEIIHVQAWPADGATVEVDFGVAGTWPSDQVCARPSAIDPLMHTAEGEVVCVPIADINTPPPPDPAGCTTTAPTPAPLALLALLALAGRRRRPTP